MNPEEYNPYGTDKVSKAIWECLKRMYKEAEPSADIEKIAKSGEGKMPNFFMAYYLPQIRAIEILEEIWKEFKLRSWEKTKVTNTVWLGSSPCFVKERTEKERKDYDKRLKKHFKELK